MLIRALGTAQLGSQKTSWHRCPRSRPSCTEASTRSAPIAAASPHRGPTARGSMRASDTSSRETGPYIATAAACRSSPPELCRRPDSRVNAAEQTLHTTGCRQANGCGICFGSDVCPHGPGKSIWRTWHARRRSVRVHCAVMDGV